MVCFFEIVVATGSAVAICAVSIGLVAFALKIAALEALLLVSFLFSVGNHVVLVIVVVVVVE